MNSDKKRLGLLSEINNLRDKLNLIPESRTIDRHVLEERIKAIEKKLDALDFELISADQFMDEISARLGVEKEFERRYGKECKLTEQRLEEIKNRTRSVPWPVSELGSTDFEDPKKFDPRVLNFLRHAVDDVVDLILEVDRLKNRIILHSNVTSRYRKSTPADKWLWGPILVEKGICDED